MGNAATAQWYSCIGCSAVRAHISPPRRTPCIGASAVQVGISVVHISGQGHKLPITLQNGLMRMVTCPQAPEPDMPEVMGVATYGSSSEKAHRCTRIACITLTRNLRKHTHHADYTCTRACAHACAHAIHACNFEHACNLCI